jgi:small-conductance mechanosensitive channel
VDGEELVGRAFDLSASSEKLRDSRLPVLASFLAGILNRVGHITLEELPDNPERARPYLLYQHAAGNIVLARTEDAEGRHRWQFSAETLDGVKALHEAVRTAPVSFENVHNPRIDSPYFRWRSLANDLSPELTAEFAGMERWQWLSVLFLAVLLPLVVHGILRRSEREQEATGGPGSWAARTSTTLLARLISIGALWVISATALGLPDRVSGPLYAMGWVLLIIAVTWQLYRALSVANRVFAALAQRTESTADDVAVTLLTGVARILLVVGAIIAIADVLGIPYQTVLAGVGVSGLALAIASRDLLANLFGSVIIASDRPFTRGDFVSVGDIMGTVERVGLRSTRLRPVDDTSVTIPNSTITTDRVVNLSRRRKIRVLETVHVSHDASVDAIRELRETLRGELLADPMVAAENVRVGLATLSLYAVEMEISFYIKTTDYDEFLYEKHRIMAHLLATMVAAGVERAVIRRD